MTKEEGILWKLNEILEHLKNQKTVLSIETFCNYTGFSRSFANKLTSSNQIPFYRPGGKHIVFNKSEVDEWLLNNRIKTKNEINSQREFNLVMTELCLEVMEKIAEKMDWQLSLKN